MKVGYEIGTGEEVEIKPSHLVATGITQESGKTTTQMALIKRGKFKAIVFKTKIGEKGITEGSIVPPYYKDEFDWEYASDLLEASRKEKLKFERAWIIKYSKTASNLLEFKKNIDDALVSLREGLEKNVLLTLQAYLDKILPELQYAPLSNTLDMRDGINIMDLERFKEETQGLIIRSVLREVLKREKNTIIIIPEAWKYIPEGRGSPVKRDAEAFIRQGATNNNFLWIDSIPSYETLFIRHNGIVETTTMEQLFNEADGAIVKTEHGEEIRGFEEGIEVLSPSSSRLVWAPIKKIIRHPYTGEILRINTKGGLVDVSPNHPLMKYPKYLVEAETLKLDDRLCMRAFEKGRHHNSDIALFIGTEDLAWFYGFFVAEGAITGKNRKHIALYNKNKSLLERAQAIIKENFHLSASLCSPRKGVYALDVASPRLVNHLKSCYLKGVKLNKYNKIVPISILNAPLAIKTAFFNGYITGDGHFDKKRGHLRGLVSASRVLMLGLTWLLHSTNEESTYTVHIRADKPKIVQLSVNKGKHRELGDRIKKIVKLNYSGFLYDLNVDSKDHTFYLGIGNVRVHNSQDITGVDKTILKQVSTWILGYQREINEIKRTIEQLPIPVKDRPTADNIATLKVGHFYVATSDFTKKVYVQPSWLDSKTAKQIALGKISVSTIKPPETLSPFAIVGMQPQESPSVTIDFGPIRKEINELRNDIFNKIQQQQEAISKVYSELYAVKTQDQKVDEDLIVGRVLQKVTLPNGVPQFNKEELIREIVSKIPKGVGNVVYEVAPLEKIQKDFLEAAKNKVLSDVSSLSDEEKKALKYVESVGKDVSNTELITKCFYLAMGGSSATKMSIITTKLKNLELLEKSAGGRNSPKLRKRIKELLEIHGATDQEVEQVYNHILMEILTK